MAFSKFLDSKRPECKALVSELRKTFAYVSILGVDIKTTSTLLGHASTQITERVYATLLPNTIAERVGDKLNVKLD